MNNDKSIILFVETAKGFGFGVFLAILQWQLAYNTQDVSSLGPILTIITILEIPALICTLPFMLSANIYVIAVMQVVMGVLQWSALGFYIGWRKYRKSTNNIPPPNT